MSDQKSLERKPAMALFGKEQRDRQMTPSEEVRTPASTTPIVEPARATPPTVSAATTDPEPMQPAAAGEVSAYLGKGSRVTGKLNFEGTVRVDGQVEGEISAQDTLVIGESAVVNAQITGSTVILKGKVTGDITARKRLEIRAPGKLFGNVTTPSLVIQEGVIFEGHCSMGGAESKAGKVTPFPKEEQRAAEVAK
jgi:cytoskeletal protein CcmA (bactofilin family)